MVAVGLPSLGDKPTFKHPGTYAAGLIIHEIGNQLTIYIDIIFAFAHLGMEIKMHRKPLKSIVSDYYATMKTSGAVAQTRPRATVVSELDAHSIGVVPKSDRLPLWKDMLQRLPITGRLFAHFPGEYH